MVLGRKRGDALPVKALADAAGRQAECAESWLACWQVLALAEIEIDGTGIELAERFLPEHGDAVFLFIWLACRAADEDGQAALRPVGIARAEAQAVDALVDDAAVHEVVVEAADFDLRVGVLVLQVEARERQVLVARLVLAVVLSSSIVRMLVLALVSTKGKRRRRRSARKTAWSVRRSVPLRSGTLA